MEGMAKDLARNEKVRKVYLGNKERFLPSR